MQQPRDIDFAREVREAEVFPSLVRHLSSLPFSQFFTDYWRKDLLGVSVGRLQGRCETVISGRR